MTNIIRAAAAGLFLCLAPYTFAHSGHDDFIHNDYAGEAVGAPAPAGLSPRQNAARRLSLSASQFSTKPTRHGEYLLPPGSVVESGLGKYGAFELLVTLPNPLPSGALTDLAVDSITEIFRMETQGGSLIEEMRVLGRLAGETEYRPLVDFVERPRALAKPEARSESEPGGPQLSTQQSPAGGQPQPTGALSGASVFLSPGHGWYYASVLSRWATQRGNTHNLIEDHSNGELVLQILDRYLWNAGAGVYPLRERHLGTSMAIVDTAAATLSGTWTNENLATAYGGSHRYASTVTGTPTATATFTPNVPAEGHYPVYVWYRPSGGGTTTGDARITINHTGGSTVWTQNQTRDGYTWKYIGTYYFDAGSNPATGSIVISNLSSTAGNRVIADAVRLGGGLGSIPDDVSGTTSGYPRWEESGRYYAGFMGKSDWASWGTVGAMPNYAQWEHEAWESGRSIYLSWHTNAPNPGTGTETYAYSSLGTGGTFNGVAGGNVLRNYVHDELVNDIRASFVPGWSDRGKKTANFGELNPSNNNAMPAALVELGFHDTAGDAAWLKDPRFRIMAARAAYQGIVKFYNAHNPTDFPISTLLPEPPTNLRVTRSGPGSVTIAWNAPPFNTGNGLLGDAATGYRVYKSGNGKGFDNGTAVAGLSTTISGLTPGEVTYFRVTATNAGGESFPTEVLAASCYAGGANPVLIVNGFDRLDEAMNLYLPDTYGGGNDQARGFLHLMNTYDYIIAHAKAINAYGRDFDSCSNEAVTAGQVNLANYHTVVWILGKESTGDSTFNSTERTLLQTFLNAGNKGLFVSGSEIGFDLDFSSNAPSFYNNYLKADYSSNSAGVYNAQGAAGSIFQSIASLTFDDGSSIYDVNSADVIVPTGGSSAALNYVTGGSVSIHDFDSLAGWQDPNFSGQTNADPASAFTIVSTPKVQGTGAGNLAYVWGGGNFIREYNSSLPQFPAGTTFRIQVHGDNSGNQTRFAFRDPSDNEIFVTAYTTVNWTGWQEISFPVTLTGGVLTKWAGTGDNAITGANVAFDSIQVNKGGSSPASGNIYFDAATYDTTPGAAGVAAIQYSGSYKLVHLGFPFETITSATARDSLMSSALNFLGTPVPVTLSEFLAD